VQIQMDLSPFALETSSPGSSDVLHSGLSCNICRELFVVGYLQSESLKSLSRITVSDSGLSLGLRGALLDADPSSRQVNKAADIRRGRRCEGKRRHFKIVSSKLNSSDS